MQTQSINPATTDLPFIPQSPEAFNRLMRQIWADHCEPAPNGGGIVLYVSRWYDDWHNARVVAKRIGLRRTGGSIRNGESGQVYRFPSGFGVWIADHGGAVDTRTNIFSPKAKTQ